MSSLMSIVFGVVLPVGLLAALLPAAARQLRGPTHPSRLLAETLTAGFVLLVCSLLLSMLWWVQLLWWAVLLTVLVAAAVTTWRTTVAVGEKHQDVLAPGPGRTASVPASAAASLPDSAAPAGLERYQPIRRRELLVNGVLWIVMIVAAVAGG